ncbi:tRNA 5-methoxyuridine(34)/uridine 5-oxyacetic acid(34) synthase CmoB [Marispirochaeta aestuarii]|uniref:tRNA 5-methoxyuridine(34)/uridine 5-oxyacetic acid(34) synthase CmoB n=1 Tax=Marispirochaeta aestuarii TaxID=1963862 RepID=A0A1Y1RTD8_9SPIO|nr:tRNA 5-methoxyuridine(34)/uridine 5-oxyacetic acid(34) synthase CmoB [Marispirochaeta aestuarii]ORC30323.1 tRNA 5-methoxyuridine(34)/uridine 5-oxyacetic acid(34) synthase CmoB [Marispirochaeta aestuarii]
MVSVDFSREYLDQWAEDRLSLPRENAEKVAALRESMSSQLNRPYNRRWWRNAVRLPVFSTDDFGIRDGVVCFGEDLSPDPGEKRVLRGALEDLKSWRKGPFSYAGIEVDAEWRSDIKWRRVMELANPDIRGCRVADVGCNNLYYMYRMLEHDPSLVIGCEPVERYFFYYYLNRKFYRDRRLAFELFGVDDLALYGPFFDLVFFMGVLYHRRHPLMALENLAAAMQPGAHLVIETAGIPGGDESCLFPGKRYMKAPGWWFLPTVKALKNMLERSGFEKVRIHEAFSMTHTEQRKTEWVDTQSLESFLDPEDPGRTVEGYPAPLRIYASAYRRL